MTDERLILASASPRRCDLLSRYALPFDIVPSNVDESVDIASSPRDQVLQVAMRKAKVVGALRSGLIIAADTIVIIEGKILEKPENRRHAAEMLETLSGNCHLVLTGLIVMSTTSSRIEKAVEETKVWFSNLDAAMIDRYLDTGEYLDKAGAYAAQGVAAAFIERIEGCYHNVVGLPLNCLNNMLISFGRSLV